MQLSNTQKAAAGVLMAVLIGGGWLFATRALFAPLTIPEKVQKVKDAVTVGMTLKSFLAQCHDTGLIEVGGRKREGAPMQEANREFRPIDAVLDVDLPEVERHYPFETKAGQLAYRINLLWGLRPGSDETILYGYYFRSPD